ncbi:MAG: DEAD/DEAH box helicase, partial [Gemmatimonadota bacterium]
MSLDRVLDAVGRAPSVQALAERLPGRGSVLRLGGLPGSSGAAVAAWIARHAPQRMIVVVAPTPGEAERWLADLTLLAGVPVALYPQREALGEEEPHYEIAGERAETIEALLSGRLSMLVTTARATAERTLVPAAVEQLRVRLAVGEELPPGELARRLEQMGYTRVATVTEVAEFSVRGGILDVYGFGMAAPARLEWWGDEISSLRAFDLTTQRSQEEMGEVTVLPIRAGAAAGTADMADSGEGAAPAESSAHATASAASASRRTLLDLLPPDALVIEEAPGPDRDEVVRAWNEAAHHLDIARRLGEDVPTRAEILEEPEAWMRSLAAFPRLAMRDETADLQMGFFPPERVDRDLARLRALLAGSTATLILCDNEGQLERMEELLEDGGRRSSNAMLAVGALDGGFVLPSLRVLTDHEIFRRARRLRRPRRYREAAPGMATGTLALGDYVVHLDHGIGIYRGIDTIMVGESTLEVAIVEYEGGDRLNVPLYRLDQLERYRAAGDDGDRPPPKLHKLGGTSWSKVRERTRQAIRQMAAELLDLYARRSVSAGYPFPPDTRWQRELESSFLYEDTPDQRTATESIKRDMEQPRPMDRLLVGDVGYGKTEVAVRAAFKAVQGGKQAAVLVPTTILAEQHGRTFGERLADFPVKVEVLSRFRTPKEQKAALARLADGQTDIIIGTHRLLSKDVVFKDLGLLVVDEEHRFGVRHKESKPIDVVALLR